MKKSILNLGKALNKAEQKTINGGGWPTNEKDCLLCGGEWGGVLCSLPSNSVCL